MMNLRQLEYFYYVAKYGGFTHAARQLSFPIQQPALSIRVKALEDNLQIKLYRIVGRRFQLTPSGEYLFNGLKPFFESLDTLERHLRGETHGRLVVAEAAPMLILKDHRKALLTFRERYPDVQISVLERKWTDLLQLVSDGTVDFAFGSSPEVHGSFSFEEWTDTDYLLLCPPGHPLSQGTNITLPEISQHPLVLLEKGTADRQHIEGVFSQEYLSANVILETSSYSLINDAVVNGAGVAIVNALWPRPESKDGWHAVNASHLFGKKRIGLFRRTNVHLPPYANDYLAMLRKTLHTSQKNNLERMLL
ncbi:MAG: LysR family transcriptional regulator [Nitrospinaceae bacterium]|jgi:DNA-binding transcriptional LysR family regulator|nr:LysR family transcriptional regulator [Nitrospinaceae bacterium]MBT3433241.1 LysR family transcriptional regulator [Nitrospinaceae bacterium]MBT4094185.1 LysR family transcriptional regulator [Nitrospinaceae bacterium]MBT4432611.1 LysR family transcriptional regulator [Nitrospinaceae bacterium]MBT5366610.1 LysR family transcriptional regulator [Nitrospinaceae bacterium]